MQPTQESTREENTKEKNFTPIVSKVLDDGTILEAVKRGKDTELAIFRNGDWRIAPEYKAAGGEIYRAISASNNLLSHGAILLPTGVEPYNSVEELSGDIKAYLRKYLRLTTDAEETVTSYVRMSWIHDALEELPYLRLLGDLGSGKTRSLRVIGSITNKPFFASAASTISPVFYALDQFSPTLILDEADMRFSDAASEFAKVFNNGTGKGMPVLRQSVQSRHLSFEPRAFHVFGPKIVAMRKRFQDDGLESRFLTTEMRAQPVDTDIPINLPKEQAIEAEILRNKLLFYRAQERHKVKVNPEHIDTDRSGRFNQMLLPLLAVTDTDEAREAITRFAKKSDDRLQAIRQYSLDATVVRIYQELSESTTEDKLAVNAIAEKVREEMEFSERPITNRLVGSILRQQLDLETWKGKGGVYWVGKKRQDE